MTAAPRYDLIAASDESTVVAEYVSDASQETTYQSEAELEAAFIELLRGQAYEYLRISNEDELLAFVRLVTNPRVFESPLRAEEALEIVEPARRAASPPPLSKRTPADR